MDPKGRAPEHCQLSQTLQGAAWDPAGLSGNLGLKRSQRGNFWMFDTEGWLACCCCDCGYETTRQGTDRCGISSCKANGRVAGSIPGRTCLGCGLEPQLGACKRQPIVSFPSPALPLSLKINK